MKNVVLFILIICGAMAACGIGLSVVSARAESLATYAIDSHLAYQQQPGVILERQLASVQANSLSNAPGFPWSLLFMSIGLALLLLVHNYERILSVKTAYLKEKTKHTRANKSNNGSRPLTPLAPIRPLNPYQFDPLPPRPALPSPVDDGDDKW